jgi:exocyst complex component 3
MRARKTSAANFKNMATRTRVIKNYRTKILQGIRDSIQERFKDAYEKDRHNPAGFLENLGWMYQDIIRIDSDVVKCFPTSWNIRELYIKQYHKSLDETVGRIVADEPEAGILLALHAWLKEYKENMKELNIPPEYIQPPLFNGKEQSLIDDYLGVIIKKMDEWTENLMKMEVEAFTQRKDPPELDADGQYGTQGAVILFQMINQQVDRAMESGQGAILAGVITDVDRVMRGIQDQWTKIVDSEFKKQVEKPEEVPGGLVEYCIALANDQIKCADYAEALSARIEPLVSEKYRVVINERLNDAIDGHLDVAKKCTQTLINMIFNDLKPATKQLFQPPWYDGIMAQVIDTMKDYTTDYNTYLSPTLFELLIADLLDTFIVTYLTALANAPKLRFPAAPDRMRADVEAASRFFGAYKKMQELRGDFEVVEMILSMLEASKSLVFLSYWSFAKVHGPNVAFVESLMKCRGDFDRSAVNEVMESVKRKVKEENLQDREFLLSSLFSALTLFVLAEEPTIMKKIAVQGIFSRFLRSN